MEFRSSSTPQENLPYYPIILLVSGAFDRVKKTNPLNLWGNLHPFNFRGFELTGVFGVSRYKWHRWRLDRNREIVGH